MGYYTRVTGRITIDLPLSHDEIIRGTLDDRNVGYDVSTETFEGDNGTVTQHTAHAVIPVTEEPFKAYTLVEDVQAFIDAHPDRDFAGYLECTGEEPGDLWRVVVRNRTAVRIEPRIVWDDEDEIAT